MSRLSLLAREPLVHFLLIGAGLFVLFALTQGSEKTAPNRIVIGPGEVERLVARFSRTRLRPPTDPELAGLIKDRVRDEVLYREALAMGLDRNDPSIRRRMRQKLEFVLENLSAEAAPSDEALTAFLQQNPDMFRLEPQVSFRQIYLNPDRHEDIAADVTAMLERLRAGASPASVGDPTMVASEFEAARQSHIAHMFGEPFAHEVVGKLAPDAWTGPVFSGLGAHLVLVTDRRNGRLPALAEIRGRVEREYLARRRKELKEVAYQKILEGYEVVVAPATASRDKASKTAAAAKP